MVPACIFFFSLLKTCLVTDVPEHFRCRGECKQEHACNAVLKQTQCDNGLVCCIDHATKNTSLFEDSKLTFNETASKSRDDCPGICFPRVVSFLCDYILSSSNSCQPEAACCLTENSAFKNNSYEIMAPVKRSVQFEKICPGKCVHLSHALTCDEILPHFTCPLNAKCCIQRSTERAFQTSKPVQCLGQCLPLKMHGYCFLPNELILSFTTCPRGTTCCMQRQLGIHIQPPSVNRMKFPHIPNKVSNSDASEVVLGQLAVDEGGTVYKVGINGQISPLPRLNPLDHMRRKFTRLAAYPRFDGDLVIFSDPKGDLFQQFYPRHPTHRSEQRKPLKQFTKDDKISSGVPNVSSNPTEATLNDDKTSRPPCPGSCMSYFLRFSCFRGYAIYDGFVCPGKLVCCARLKDIEDHEEHLKSLSPYFSKPPFSHGKTFHRCGIKGRRDSPRIIGGKESLPGEWCWQVAIINVQNQYICGGALIDNSWVLTAAYCVSESMKDDLFVRAGVTDLKSLEDNEKGQTIRVLFSFIHHNFDSINLDNNIALLRLQKPFDFNANVCVICLPTTGQMPSGSKKCTVTGYGFISKDGAMSLQIREAQVPIIDDTECINNATEALANSFTIPANSFCAGGQGQQDVCQGDAGGPLACEVGGYHELIGLISWGLGCGRNDVPSIYIKIPAFMGWINQIISSSSFLMSLT